MHLLKGIGQCSAASEKGCDMKKSVIYSGLGASIVIIHIGFLALHHWVGEHLEVASTEGRGAARWWTIGGFAFLSAFAIIMAIAFRLSGRWPKLLDGLYLCGNAALSAILLDTSVLLDVPEVRAQMLHLHLTFVGSVIFEGGFMWFLLVLSSSIAHGWRASPISHSGDTNRGLLHRFAAAFAAGHKQVSDSRESLGGPHLR